jgi:hypothetical protein
MTTSLKTKASEVTPQTIGAAICDFQKKCAGHAESQIALTNEARKIGLLVQAWTGHEQISFDFFNRHKAELPKQVSYQSLKTFVAIANKLPGAVKRLDDARKVWQATFESAGLLELPERSVPQKRADMTHYMELVNRLGNVRNVIADWLRDEPAETWNAETRKAVAAQIKPLADFYRQLTEATP